LGEVQLGEVATTIRDLVALATVRLRRAIATRGDAREDE
jgi:hypothetical protein